MKESMEDLKTNDKVPSDPAILLLGIYPKKIKSVPQRDIYAPCPLKHSSQQPTSVNNLGMFQWINGKI